MYHLVIKPAKRGTPIKPKETKVKAAIVKGILYPIPAISLMFLFPVFLSMDPATKNIVIFWNA